MHRECMAVYASLFGLSCRLSSCEAGHGIVASQVVLWGVHLVHLERSEVEFWIACSEIIA
jgi:hypothetical protein